jgi:hypothetical protein
MEEEFEIKSAHEAAIEHGAEHHVALAQKIALFSAVVATIGAVFSFLAGHTQNEALYHKDEAVLLKAQASDQWSYFQAESGKQHIAMVAAELVPAAKRDIYLKQAKTYTAKKAEIQRKAEALDQRSLEADHESEHALAPHNKLALAMTFIQIAIALASIAALTRRRWLLTGAALTALVGIGVGGAAWVLGS